MFHTSSGAVDHEDFAGNAGTIESGGLQFMTAGRGIMHAEMPRQNADGSANVGLQLWVDLPTHLKACEPRYRDLKAKEIPAVDLDDGKVHIKVISGQAGGVDSVQDVRESSHSTHSSAGFALTRHKISSPIPPYGY